MLLAALACARRAIAATPERLQLTTGELRELQFPEGADLRVSRRGVVDLYHAGHGLWQITALQAGFVVIDARIGEGASASDDTAARYLVTVTKRAVKGRAGASTRAADALPDWLCTPKGILCDRAAASIGGRTSSYSWYRSALHFCDDGGRCRIDAELTPDSRRAWAAELQRALGSDYLVRSDGNGPLHVATTCGKDGRQRRRDTAAALGGGDAASGAFVVICREDAAAEHYKLSARVFLVESSAAEQLGFDGESTLVFAADPVQGRASTAASMLSRLRALAAERRAEIVGEPVVRLVANEPARLLTGGEFQVVEYETSRDDAPRASWKKHGLELAVTAKPIGEDRVRLGYELSLSARTSSSAAALAVNSVASSVDLPLGTSVIVSALDMKATGRSSSETPVLAHLPLIGPLFSLSGDERSASRLLVWFQLREDDGAPEL
jgi:hypothetical protein